MNYDFFGYKGNIDYHGEHYGSGYQTAYLIGTVVLALLLSLLLRKVKKEKILKSVGWIGVGVTLFYLVKTIWESHYDVASGSGFNTYILPFDACSIIMWAAIIGGFCKGWFADWSLKWMPTLGFACGFSNVLFLQALNYYPFFSFGALYSVVWHASMVFIAWWLLISGTVRMKWIDILKSFGFHAVFSVLPITINLCVSHMNYMLYDDAGGVPIIEDLCRPYADTWKATAIMLGAYLLIDALLVCFYKLVDFVCCLIAKKVKAAREDSHPTVAEAAK